MSTLRLVEEWGRGVSRHWNSSLKTLAIQCNADNFSMPAGHSRKPGQVMRSLDGAVRFLQVFGALCLTQIAKVEGKSCTLDGRGLVARETGNELTRMLAD